MLGSIEEFNTHNPIVFPKIQHDVLGESFVDDLLLPIIQPR
jgi:hypothetical protein